jgi:topoisomerase IA-like protein
LFESIANASQGEAVNAITLEQVARLIEERLKQFQREKKPLCREQFVTDAAFDTKAFAAAVKGVRSQESGVRRF